MKTLTLFLALCASAFADTWKAGFYFYNNGVTPTEWTLKVDGVTYITNPLYPGVPSTYWIRGYYSETPPVVTAHHTVPGVVQVGASLIASGTDVVDKLIYTGPMYSEDGPGGMSDPALIPLRVQGEQVEVGVIWKTDDTTLTANLFREGIDKLAGSAASSSSGGSGGDAETVASLQLAAEAAKPTTVTMSSEATAAGAAFNAAMGDVTASLRGTITASVPTSSGSIFAVTIPRGPSAAVEVDLNPLAHPSIAAIAAWIKLVLTVLLLIGFEAWVWTQFDDYVKAFVQVPQAKGNTIAGTGGQATGLIAAGILAALITSLPAAFFAVYGGSFTAIGVLGSSELMPATQSFFVAAFYVLSAFFPVTVALAVLAQWFVVRKAGTALFGVACIGVKFIVP